MILLLWFASGLISVALFRFGVGKCSIGSLLVCFLLGPTWAVIRTIGEILILIFDKLPKFLRKRV